MPSLCYKSLLLLLACVVLSNAAHAQVTDFDDKAAVIFTYMAIGDDDTAISEERFKEQMDELSEGGYNVAPLPEIITAFEQNKSLPARTVAITFDGADKSIYDTAFPILREKGFEFTVFLPVDRITDNKPQYLTWNDAKDLKEGGGTFGIHPASYGNMIDMGEEETRRQINNSTTKFREKLGMEPTLLAYPFGEYNTKAKKIAKDMGFKAAFGQASGVSYAGDDRFALPRFTITERYGDIDRFKMTANALPLPVTEISPADPHLSTLTPAIGFTVNDALKKSLKGLSCFSSVEEKPKLEILNGRVELRLEKPFDDDRPRINCTLPVAGEKGSEPRWRWLGMLYTVSEDILSDAQKQPTQHAGDNNDQFSVE